MTHEILMCLGCALRIDEEGPYPVRIAVLVVRRIGANPTTGALGHERIYGPFSLN